MAEIMKRVRRLFNPSRTEEAKQVTERTDELKETADIAKDLRKQAENDLTHSIIDLRVALAFENHVEDLLGDNRRRKEDGKD